MDEQNINPQPEPLEAGPALDAMAEFKKTLNQEQFQQKPIQEKPQIQPTAPRPEPVYRESKKSGFGKFIFTLFLIILLAVGGLGGVLFARVWDPLWNPFRPKPEDVLSQMIINMQDVKTLKTNSSIKISTETNKSVQMGFSGSSDVKDIAKPKADINFDILFSMAGADSKDTAKARVIMIGEDIYFNISEMNMPSFDIFLQMSGLNLDQIKNKWLKFPSDLVRQQNITADQSAELSKKIKEMYSKNKFYFVKEQLPDEKIGNVSVYHYVISLDNKKFADLFSKLVEETMEQQAGESDSLAGQEYVVAAVQGMVSKFLEKIGEINMDFRIGKKDLMLYGFSVKKSIDLSAVLDPDIKEKIAINISANYSDFNKPSDIKVPEVYENMEDVFPEIKNQRIKSDMYNLESAIYSLKLADGNYSNVSCQNEKLKDLCAKIKTDSGNDVVINKSKTYYCAYTKLLGNTGNYFCINSSYSQNGIMRSIETDTNPSSFCKTGVFKCPPPPKSIIDFGF